VLFANDSWDQNVEGLFARSIFDKDFKMHCLSRIKIITVPEAA
jgi:hypothetical protein